MTTTKVEPVDGLDVRAGMRLRHPRAGIVKVLGAAREQVSGGHVVNRVKVETSEGKRGWLELRAGQSFMRVQSGA